MTMPEKIPDWMAERIALGEYEGDAKLSDEQRAALARSNEEILAELPPERVVPEIERRLRTEKRRRERARHARRATWAGALMVTATATAALLLVVRPGGEGRRGGDAELAGGEEGIRTKGDARLVIHRRVRAAEGTAASTERLEDGAEARAGDELQVSYIAAGSHHGVILSIDGRGTVTLHFPASGGGTELRDDEAVALAHSYELDDAPGFERFFFVTSADPIVVANVVEAAGILGRDPEAARNGRLAGPDSWKQTSFLLRKAVSR